MRSILLIISAIAFIWLLSPLSWAEGGSAPLGRVAELWGKKVVKIKFADPSKVKKKDIYYICRGDKVIGKVEVYELGRETIYANLLESNAVPESGDVIKAEGEMVQAKAIDIDSYDKIVFPIFLKTCENASAFANAITNFNNSIVNRNDPTAMATLRKEVSQAGSDGWWRFMRLFQSTFTSPEMKKTFTDGSAFITESMTTLKAMKPPEAVESPHRRLISLLSQMQVVFTAFKDIPTGQDNYSLNYMATVGNRFFAGDMKGYTKNVIMLCAQTVNEYFEVFPEWKTRDSKGSMKKVI